MASTIPPVEAVARAIYASWWDTPEDDDAAAVTPPPWEDLAADDPARLGALSMAASAVAALAATRP